MEETVTAVFLNVKDQSAAHSMIRGKMLLMSRALGNRGRISEAGRQNRGIREEKASCFKHRERVKVNPGSVILVNMMKAIVLLSSVQR